MGRNSPARWLTGVFRMFHLRKCLLALVVLVLLWGFTMVNVFIIFSSQANKRDSQTLKSEIIQLSEEYIKALAKENGDIVDGPYAGRFTAFDLKKTIAVLLESMLSRISRLEAVVNNITNSSGQSSNNSLTIPSQSRVKSSFLSAKDLIAGKREKCELSDSEKKQFPNCEQKIEWMRAMWKSDRCYQAYGVDGSDCSIIMYLSEVEGFCPRQPWTRRQNNTFIDSGVAIANMSLDLQPLMELLKDPNSRQGYAWIRMRITGMWPQWVSAAKHLMEKQKMAGRVKQKILVHLGLLSKQSGWKFAELQFKGGPLGELVQWSDLISTLYILGHELTITSEVEQLVEILNHVPSIKSPCQSRKELPVHLIYTDIMGLIQFKKRLKSGYAKFRCLFRVVDSFGTEPAFNHKIFAKQNRILSSWGGQDLNPKQFYTMFPHSPDNSFMGFVVDRLLNETDRQETRRENMALIYGKKDYIWQGKKSYLDLIHERLEVHGTVYQEPDKRLQNVPSYVINHGLLSGVELHKLLRTCKVFVGLGFPYEGPAPLEAIANGAVFLNPKFSPPHHSKNHKFFKGKPTLREVTSQHPYAEVIIGEPFVYTVNMNDTNQIRAVLDKILKQSHFKSRMQYEYTEEGMLQRMNAFIENQNFCSNERPVRKWPPRSSVSTHLAPPGRSCKDFCWDKHLMCEPAYFEELNSKESMSNLTECSSWTHSSNIYYPAVDPRSATCTTQDEKLLFSCVGSMMGLRRLCPCRNYMPEQTALCVGCVS